MFKKVMCCGLFILFFGVNSAELYAHELNMTDFLLRQYYRFSSKKELDMCNFDGSSSMFIPDYFDCDFDVLLLEKHRGISEVVLLLLMVEIKDIIVSIAHTDSSILNSPSCAIYEYVRSLIDFYDKNKIIVYCEHRNLADWIDFIKFKIEEDSIVSSGDIDALDNVRVIISNIVEYELGVCKENDVDIEQCKKQKQIEWFGFGKNVDIVNDESVYWELVSKEFANKNIHSLYAADGDLYVDTLNKINEDDEYFFGAYGRAYRSYNGGRGWRVINEGARIKVFYFSDGILYVGTNGGVHKSDNYGETWQRLDPSLEQESVNSLFMNDEGIFYAGIFDGVYTSKNMGKNWTRVNEEMVGTELNWQGIERLIYLLDVEGVLYAVTSSTRFGESFVFSSSDGGKSWTDRTWSYGDDDVFAFYAVGKILYAGTSEGLYRSDDGGKNWKVVVGLMDKVIFSIHAIGDALYVASHGGVFRSNDGGETWVSVNNGLMVNEQGGFVATVLCSLNGVLYVGGHYGLYKMVDQKD